MNYSYDAVGNRTKLVEMGEPKETVDGTTGNMVEYSKRETNYSYSVNNELLGVTEELFGAEEAVVGGKATQYSYDPNGNRYMTLSAALSEGESQAELGLTTGAAEAVEMTQASFDGFGRLSGMTRTKGTETVSVTYAYNGDGLRQSQSVNQGGVEKTTGYVYDGSYVVQETGEATAAYVRGLNYVAKIGASGGVSYYQYNAHGDVVQTTDGAGAVQNRYDYGPFGEEESREETAENSLRYGGEFFDEASELYYQRARYYEPGTGQFLSEDTYAGNAADPASFNRYAFCNNDPVNFVDPSGHSALGLGIGLGIGAGLREAASAIRGALERAKEKQSSSRPAQQQGMGGTSYFLINPSNTGAATRANQESAFNARWLLGMDRVVDEIASTGGTLATTHPTTGETIRMDKSTTLYNRKSGRPHRFANKNVEYEDSGMPHIKGGQIGTWQNRAEGVVVYDVQTGEQKIVSAQEAWLNQDRYVRDDHKTYIYDREYGTRYLVYGSEIPGILSWADPAEKWNLEHPNGKPRLDYVNDGDNELYFLLYIPVDPAIDPNKDKNVDSQTIITIEGPTGKFRLNQSGEKMGNAFAKWDAAGADIVIVLCPGRTSYYPDSNYVLSIADKLIEKAPNARFALSTDDVGPQTPAEYSTELNKFTAFADQILSDPLFDKLSSHFAGIYFTHETYGDGLGYGSDPWYLNETKHLAYAVSEYVHGELSDRVGRQLELIWAPCLPYIRADYKTGEIEVGQAYIDQYLRDLQSFLNHDQVLVGGNLYPVFDRVFLQPTLYFEEEIVNDKFDRHKRESGGVTNTPAYKKLNDTLYMSRKSIEKNMGYVITTVDRGVAYFGLGDDTNTSGTKFAADIEMSYKVIWPKRPGEEQMLGWAQEYTQRWTMGHMLYAGYTSEIIGENTYDMPPGANTRAYLDYIEENVFGLTR